MQSILQYLFKKNALADVSVEEITHCVQQYPFFPLGHFLLTKKLQPFNETAFLEQLEKTTLYFHDPLWLHYLLQQPEFLNKPEELRLSEAEKLAAGTEGPDKASSASDPFPGDLAVGDLENTRAFASTHDMIEDVVLHQESIYEIPGDFAVKRPPVLENEVVYAQAADSQAMIEQERAGAPEEEEEDSADDTAAAPVPLQAYYTIDYFASQGIKIGNEIKADDKLGKQLKSFTEWLKTMRRLPEVTEEVMEKSSDKEVEQLAAHSLEENEVITEAMAEVLVKQGKHQQAGVVYRKLSLINPLKIAYFAAKIEALNLH